MKNKVFSVVLLVLLFVTVFSGCAVNTEPFVLDYVAPITNNSPLGQIKVADVELVKNLNYKIVPYDSEKIEEGQIGLQFEGTDILNLSESEYETYLVRNSETRTFSIKLKCNKKDLETIKSIAIPVVFSVEFY